MGVVRSCIMYIDLVKGGPVKIVGLGHVDREVLHACMNKSFAGG